MTDFYEVPVAELENRYEALVRRALPLWGIDRDAALSLLKLRENAVYAVTDSATKEALVAGYRQTRPLPDDHLAWFPVLLMARATTYLGWMHTRSETETAREMTPYIIELVTNLAEDYLGNL